MDRYEYERRKEERWNQTWDGWQWTGLSGHGLLSGAKDLLGYLGGNLDDFGTLVGLTEDDKAELLYHASGFPVIGDVIHADDSNRYITDYMRNTGLSWSDVRYITQMRGAGTLGHLSSSALNFVSKNLEDLYR